METFEQNFKPEVRSAGEAFRRKDKVTLSQPSDTEIISYVRTTPPVKVVLKTPQVESDTIFAQCGCPLFAKGQYCKHLWAALSLAQETKPDFFEGKTQLAKGSVSGTSPLNKPKPKLSEEQLARQEEFKERQRDYQKLQYQKQKLAKKKMKLAKEQEENADEYPPAVETALKYFSQNGFDLRGNEMTQENVSFAMKRLSRVFHPDKGGSHEEFTELNQNSEILSKFSIR